MPTIGNDGPELRLRVATSFPPKAPGDVADD